LVRGWIKAEFADLLDCGDFDIDLQTNALIIINSLFPFPLPVLGRWLAIGH